MKILHTSDWHLGLDFYGASLLRDQEAMVDRIADIAAQERVGAVLLAGDVFDRAVVGADAMGVYNRAMRRLCLEERIPVVVCAGNHDGAARLSLLQELLAPSGLHVFGRAGAQDDRVDLGEAVVHVLPYCTTDDARLSFPAEREAIGSAADAVAAFLAHRAPERDGRFHILLGHCFAAGGQAGRSDRAAAVGGEHPLVKAAVAAGRETYVSPTTSDRTLMPFPALKMGPGQSSRSHTADEFVLLEEIAEGIAVYEKYIGKLAQEYGWKTLG